MSISVPSSSNIFILISVEFICVKLFQDKYPSPGFPVVDDVLPL